VFSLWNLRGESEEALNPQHLGCQCHPAFAVGVTETPFLRTLKHPSLPRNGSNFYPAANSTLQHHLVPCAQGLFGVGVAESGGWLLQVKHAPVPEFHLGRRRPVVQGAQAAPQIHQLAVEVRSLARCFQKPHADVVYQIVALLYLLWRRVLIVEES